MPRYKVRKGFTFHGPTYTSGSEVDVFKEGAILDIPEAIAKPQEWKLEPVPVTKKDEPVVRVITKPTENRAVTIPPQAKAEPAPAPVPAKKPEEKPKAEAKAKPKPAGKVVRVK